MLLGDVAVRLLQGGAVTVSKAKDPGKVGPARSSPLSRRRSSSRLPSPPGGRAPRRLALLAGASAVCGAAGTHGDATRPAGAPGAAGASGVQGSLGPVQVSVSVEGVGIPATSQAK